MAGSRTLAKLVVELAANSADFNKKIDKAKSDLFSFGKDTKQALSQAAGYIAGALTTAATSAVYMAKQSIDAADDLLDLAAQANATTEDLSGYAYAAKFAGIESAQFHGSLIKLNRSIADAGRGKAIGQLFKDMGVSIRDSNGQLRDSVSIMLDVADVFSRTADGANKTLIASQLFGRGVGTKMIPVLNQGRTALMEMKDEAAEFNLVVGTEFAEQASRINDNLDKMKGAAQGVANVIAMEFADSFEGATDKLVEMSKETEAYNKVGKTMAVIAKSIASIALLIYGAFDSAGRAIAGAAAALTFFAKRDWEGAAAAWKAANDDLSSAGPFDLMISLWEDAKEKIESSAEKTGDAIKDGASKIGEAGEEIILTNTEELKSFEAKEASIKAVIDALKMEADTIGMSASQVEAYKLAQMGASEETQKQAAALREKIELHNMDMESLDSAIAKEERMNDLLSKHDEIITGANAASREYTETVKELNELRAEGALAEDQYIEAMVNAQYRLKEKMEENEDKWFDMEEIGKTVASNIQNDLAEFLFDPFDKGLDGMLKSLVNTLKKMAAEIIAAKLIQSFFSYMGWSTGGATTTSPGPAPRAVGGSAVAGKMYRVNEKGVSEYFVPSSSGTISPHGGGGPTVNVNVHGANASVEKRVNGGTVDIDIIVENAIGKMVANGRFERQMSAASIPMTRRGMR